MAGDRETTMTSLGRLLLLLITGWFIYLFN